MRAPLVGSMWKTNHKNIITLCKRGWYWWHWLELALLPREKGGWWGALSRREVIDTNILWTLHVTRESTGNTKAATSLTDTQGDKDRGQQRDVDWSLGPAQEDHQTAPWGSHTDRARSWDACINMMKCIKRQRGSPYEWYVSAAQMADSLRGVFCYAMLPKDQELLV